jgi:5-methyltetrahydropteroyltriglutamate--homocysteine methyltransferase
MSRSVESLLPTTIVGSFPQPEWLIDRERLGARLPPRVRLSELWRVPEPFLEQAQDDATLVAVHEMERIGIDIITDGEVRRESYSNRFANALDGVDLDRPGEAMDRTGHMNAVPKVVGPIRRRHPVQVRDVALLKAATDRQTAITVPGPFTMAQQAQNDFYPSEREMALDYADAVNAEIRDLFAAGVDVVQIDEPYLQARSQKALEYGVETLQRALRGIEGEVALHICFGYARFAHDRPDAYSFLPELAGIGLGRISIETAQSGLDLSVLRKFKTEKIMLGVIDLNDPEVETPEVVAARIERAFDHIEPERIIVAPDCGMKYLPRERAIGKLKAMTAGAALVRDRLSKA